MPWFFRPHSFRHFLQNHLQRNLHFLPLMSLSRIWIQPPLLKYHQKYLLKHVFSLWNQLSQKSHSGPIVSTMKKMKSSNEVRKENNRLEWTLRRLSTECIAADSLPISLVDSPNFRQVLFWNWIYYRPHRNKLKPSTIRDLALVHRTLRHNGKRHTFSDNLETLMEL